MTRKKARRINGSNLHSTNSISMEQISASYHQNIAIAPLIISDFDTPGFSAQPEDNHITELLLGRLAEEIVHQIGNPLCALKGFIALAAQQDNALEAWYPHMQQEVAQMEKALQVFSIIAGSAYETAKRVDLCSLAADVINRFTPLAIERGVWITQSYPPAPLTVKVTEERMEMALTQLLNNALEASLPGEVIDLHLQKAFRQARIMVNNKSSQPLPAGLTGGIRPFCSTKPGHAGLGLWLADRVTRGYGGSLKIESRDMLITATMSLPLAY